MIELANRISRFLRLRTSDKCLLLAAFVLVVIIRIGLWILPFRVLQKMLSKITFASFSARYADDLVISQIIVRFVRFAAQFMPMASCLTQALAALTLLRMCGQEAELKFGIVFGEDKKLAAHAWLEQSGTIIIGKLPDHRKFTTLKSENFAAL